MVPVAGVLVPGLSGRPAQQLSLAPNRADRDDGLSRLVHPLDGAPSAVVEALARQDLATTVAEDVALVSSVQRGLASRGYTAGPLVIDPAGGIDSEHAIAAIAGWVRKALAD